VEWSNYLPTITGCKSVDEWKLSIKEEIKKKNDELKDRIEELEACKDKRSISKKKKKKVSAPVIPKKVDPVKEAVKKAKKWDEDIARKLKTAVYSKECPPQHFHGNGIDVQLELAAEAAKQMIIDNHWGIETFISSLGVITHAIFVLPETEK